MLANSRTSSSLGARVIVPGVIFAVGVLLSLWMLNFTQNGGVYSASDGLKAVLAQPGFMFSLVTAPFYALLGDRGLYVVPLLSLWAIWGRFWQIGLRARWDGVAIAVSLVALMLASPLSWYGSRYSAHTLAIALAFWGVTALLYPRYQMHSRALSRDRMLTSGVLLGLATGFRPEFVGLIVAASVLVVASWLLPQWRLTGPLTAAKVFIFIGAMVCTVGIFLALNYGIYGHPLGLQATQFLAESAAASQVGQVKARSLEMFSETFSETFTEILNLLGRYFPVVIAIAFAVLCSPEFERARLKTTNRFKGFKTPYAEAIGIVSKVQTAPIPARLLLALSLLSILILPLASLFVPAGDGGDRQEWLGLCLMVMPLLCGLLGEQLRLGFFQPWARRVMLLGTAVAIAFGIYINIVEIGL